MARGATQGAADAASPQAPPLDTAFLWQLHPSMLRRFLVVSMFISIETNLFHV
jgi:hypothetical protein